MAIDIVKYIIDQATKTAGNLIDQAKETPGISEALEEAESRQQAKQPEPQQPVYQTPARKKPVADDATEEERKSVVVDDNRQPSLDEQAQQRYEDESVDDGVAEQATLQPSVSTQGSQNLDELQDNFNKWWQEYSERGGDDRIGGEVQRRFTNMDTGELASPLDWNILGFTSQQTTPQAARDLYDYYFAQQAKNGAPENKVERTWGNEKGKAPDSFKAAMRGFATPDAMSALAMPDDYYQSVDNAADEIWNKPVVDANAIDDGQSPESRGSLYMTGEQYKRYLDLGLPGRDPDDIRDNAIYSKQDEQENYGFIPYLPDQASLQRFHDDAAANAVNNVFNRLTDLRRNNTTYSLNYDGNTYDAKDFNDKYNTWVDRAFDNAGKPFDDASMVTEDSVPLTWVLHDSVTNEDVYAPSGEAEITTDPKTGLPMIDFHTGDDKDNWYFDSEDDFNQSVGFDYAGNDYPVLSWKDMEPLVLEDGQKIRADKAFDLYDNQNDYADYGFLDWGRPAVTNPIEEGGWAPWFVDMALGSAPLFWAPTAATQAIGNTYQNMQGFRAGYQNDNGEYKLLSEDPTREQQLMTSAGSAILPATERLWGSIGRLGRVSRLPGANRFAQKYPEIAAHPATILAEGALGEGLEEIPGNLVEEMQSSGTVGDYFADDLYYYLDGNGDRVYTTDEANPNNPDEKYYAAYDSQGKRLKDQSTDFWGRWNNFWEEAPASMLGGSVLGGTISALPYVGEANQARGPYRQMLEDRAREREKVGYNMNIPEEVLEYTRRQAGE